MPSNNSIEFQITGLKNVPEENEFTQSKPFINLDEPIFSMTIPAKVQSYLAFGVPLLGVLAGEGANLIDRTRSGLTAHPGKPADLAETIKKFIKLSQEERAEMGRNAMSLSRDQFNREKLFDELQEKFEKICPSRS